MANLPLSLACIDFVDRTRALFDGQVQVPGVDLTCVPLQPTDVFTRVPRFAEFDVGEVSMAVYLALLGKGDDRFVGIPAFTVRWFVHGCVFVNTGAGIERPEDLVGKRVGVPELYTTGVMWIRGILEHAYGVKSSQLHWFSGGADNPFYLNRPGGLTVPPDTSVEFIPPERTLSDLLESGEIDAWLGAGWPACFERGSPRVRRLFPNYRELDKEYARRTGFFPILHTMIMRRDVYRRNPWLARSVLQAFERARQIGVARLINLGAFACGLPWLPDHVAELRELMGGDPYPYGLKANREMLETMATYAAEQALTPERLDVDRMFATQTVES